MLRYREMWGSRRRLGVLLLCSFAVFLLATAVDAAAADDPPSELWQQFPLDGQGTTPAPPETTPTSAQTPPTAPQQTTPAPQKATPGAFQPPTVKTARTSATSGLAASDRSWIWIAFACALVGLALATLIWLLTVAWVRKRGDVARFGSRLAGAIPPFRRPRVRAKTALPAPAFQPAHAYAGAQRRPPSRDTGREKASGGWQLMLGRFRRGRRSAAEAAEPAIAATESDSRPELDDRESTRQESKRSLDLIERYHAAPTAPAEAPAEESMPFEAPSEEHTALPEPADELAATLAAEAAATTEPLGEEELEPRREEPPGDLMSLLGAQIAIAREAHHAMTLVAVRFLEPPDEAPPEPDELRERVGAAVHEVLVSTEEPQVVVDSEEHVVWLALPGVLPKRAQEVVSEARRLLNEDRLTPLSAAVCAYPRDGATAEELLEHCRAELETAGADAIPADWRSEVSG